MAELGEKQYDLDGLIFGLDSDGVEVDSEGFQPGAADIVTQDSNLPGADGVRFGKDYKGSSTWGFSCFTNGRDEEHGWELYSAFAKAWDARAVRLTSQQAMPLRYRLAGKSRRVYGRPRRLTPVVNNLSLSGRIGLEADFTVAYPYFFDDVEENTTFGIGAPLELDAGIPVPFIPPFVSSAGSAPRSGEVWIKGDVPTPLVIKVIGPVGNPLVRVDGVFAAQVDGFVEAGNPVTFDARPWVRSATTAAGGSVPVSPRVTQLSKMWLPPGRHQIIFTGDDITSTAKVSVSWRNAHSSPR
jgi:hypothetical protein